MKVKLVVVQGKPEGREIALGVGKFLIGRGSECHLRPSSDLVSRHHCLFVHGEHDVRLRDLRSTNGTRVNGERITDEVVLRSGDLIQVGPLGFRLEMEPVPALAPVTHPMNQTAEAAFNLARSGKPTKETDYELVAMQETAHDATKLGQGPVAPAANEPQSKRESASQDTTTNNHAPAALRNRPESPPKEIARGTGLQPFGYFLTDIGRLEACPTAKEMVAAPDGDEKRKPVEAEHAIE